MNLNILYILVFLIFVFYYFDYNETFINEDDQSFQKLRKIVYHIGNQDINITQKIKLKDQSDPESDSESDTESDKKILLKYNFDEEIIKKLKLEIKNRIMLAKTQNEQYKILQSKCKKYNIKSTDISYTWCG